MNPSGATPSDGLVAREYKIAPENKKNVSNTKVSARTGLFSVRVCDHFFVVWGENACTWSIGDVVNCIGYLHHFSPFALGSGLDISTLLHLPPSFLEVPTFVPFRVFTILLYCNRCSFFRLCPPRLN